MLKNKPIPGVLATAILGEAIKDATAPVFPAVGDGYSEPASVQALKSRLASATRDMVDPKVIADEYRKLATDAIKRVEELSAALMPFATHGLMMANMTMVLTGAGRPGEPSGGTWLNGLQSAQMQSNETLFYLAADAVGRKAVEERTMEIFNRIQNAQAAARERDAHVESATLEGPIGGPVSGKTH